MDNYRKIPITGIVNAIIFAVLVLFLVQGCAVKQVDTVTAIPVEHIERSNYEFEEGYWWYARFKITWPDEYPPDGAVDLFLADKVIRPVLQDYSDNLFRWRFHRRAARDHAGHQFSFIFYASSEIASEIFERIKANKLLLQAVSFNKVEKLLFDDTTYSKRPDLGDTSDPVWSEKLRKHWPAYIMGVSAMWLGLIDEYRDKSIPDNELDIQLLIDTYREAGEKITNIWYEQGQHALLHHLSAIFGYEPILIRKEIRF